MAIAVFRTIKLEPPNHNITFTYLNTNIDYCISNVATDTLVYLLLFSINIISLLLFSKCICKIYQSLLIIFEFNGFLCVLNYLIIRFLVC